MTRDPDRATPMSMAKRKLTRDEWRRTIDEWRRSGQPREEFCERRGLNPRTMLWWQRILAKGGRGSTTKEVETFVEVTSAGEVVVSERIEIEVGGVKLRVPTSFDERVLRRVLAVLEARR